MIARSEETPSVHGSGETVETKLRRIAEKARNEPSFKFTSLYHLMNEELLRECFKRLRKDAAEGICESACNNDPPLRSMTSNLDKKAKKFCPSEVLHGFTRGKNPVTNAKAHINHLFTLNFDLSDFFDSVTADKLSGKLSKEELELVLVDPGDGKGLRACQGLPTSPAVANIAASTVDDAILIMLKKKDLQVVYTRYADDLSFSFDDPEVSKTLLDVVPQIVSRCGFKINKSKTHLMAASAGRRNVTGIMVDDHDVHAPRDLRRRMRAAKHNLNKADNASEKDLKSLKDKYYGLKGVCDCHEPKVRKSTATAIDGMDYQEAGERLAKLWKIGTFKVVESNNQDVLEDNFIITRDPAYVLGMSTYTTTWTSCMAHPNGQYRRGSVFWYGNSGSSLAALLSDKTKIFAGVERRVMAARCLLHTFTDGTVAFDKLYGDISSIKTLREILIAKGFVPTSQVNAGTKVVGSCRRGKPYFDTLRQVSVKIQKGSKTYKEYSAVAK